MTGREAFDIAFDEVYGQPPPSKDPQQRLDAAYVERAKEEVALQSSRRVSGWRQYSTNALGRQVAEP